MVKKWWETKVCEVVSTWVKQSSNCLTTSCIRVPSVGGETPGADPGVNEYNTDSDDNDDSNEIFEQCRSLLVDHGPSFLVKQKTGSPR